METNKKSIDILYKYRPIDKYTVKLLENNELHFSFPSEFNDPFDCDASIEYSGTNEEIVDWIKKKGTNEEVINILKFLEQTNYNITSINLLLEKLLEPSVKSTIPIYCLAEKKDNILMWSHYSDKHKGICLGFKTSQEKNALSLQMDEEVNKIEPQNRAIFFKVNYQEAFPRAFNPMKNDSLVLFEFLKTKSKLWEYEQEYRAHIIFEYFNKLDFKFSKDILSEVIFGVQTPEEDMRLIIDIVNKYYIKNGVDVKLYKAEKVKGKIEIEFKRIN